MVKDYTKKYVSEEKLKAHSEYMAAMQAGGQAQVPANAGAPQQAPEGAPQGGGAQNPEEMIGAFIQAMQANDEAKAREIAFQFTGLIAQQYMSQQQAAGATPAMRDGGVAPKMKFDKNGKVIR